MASMQAFVYPLATELKYGHCSGLKCIIKIHSATHFSTFFRLMPKELNNYDWHFHLFTEGQLQAQWFLEVLYAIYYDWCHQNCPLIYFPSFPIWADLHRTCRVAFMDGSVVRREQSLNISKIYTKRIHNINEGHGTFLGNIIVSEDRVKSLPWQRAQNCISITK